jgi:hypothetical protein
MTMTKIQRSLVLITTGAQLAATACMPKKPPPAMSAAPASKVNEQMRTVFTRGNDLRRVRTPEYVKTYHLGRGSTRDGRLMHEAHRVYQIEKSSRWNLARSNPPLASNAPVTQIIDQSFRPLPESGQIRAEVARQRELTAQIELAKERLTATIAEARKRTVTDHAYEARIAQLGQEITTLQEALAASGNPANPGESNEDQTVDQTKALRDWGDRQDEP